ncbi:MAG: hypothetical protein Q8S73_14020 [Deltaproteobacteria bacterium]|nr:hypothetical protein [Myxococcales bacterium]MDP3215219.1 hypothetical protein [Deltaproteobacteria bacterium]
MSVDQPSSGAPGTASEAELRSTGTWVELDRAGEVNAFARCLDVDGFSKEPAELARIAGVKRFGGLEDFPRERCAALLGDAGMGKSHALVALEHRLRAAGQSVVLRRLGAYGEGRLSLDGLFDGPEFDPRHRGPLWLLLDALDESPYPPERAADILFEKLQRLDLGQIYLRVSMRSLVWSERVRDTFAQLFGSVLELQLLPLRRSRVASLLPDDGPTLGDLVTQHLGPLLARPLTRRLVLDAQASATSPLLPEIYDRALRRRYERAVSVGTIGAERAARVERIMRAADLLGAATILGGHSSFAPVPTLGGDALDVSSRFGLVADAAVDALQHGPFVDVASARAWEHQNLAEFHAARWVFARDGSARDKARWLTGATGSLDALPTPVQGVATWLAAIDGAFFDHLLQHAPVILVSIDRASMSDDRVVRVVRALLDAAPNAALDRWQGDRLLRALGGAGVDRLAAQRILDPNTSPEARWLALEIAELNGGIECVAASIRVAFDRARPRETREMAARVVAERGRDADRLALRALALDRQDDDVNDQLKGIALLALWRSEKHPNALISLDEMLAALTEARQRHYFGAYQRARGEFFKSLLRRELPTVLSWATARVDAIASDDFAQQAEVDELVRLAWESADHEAVARPLARLASQSLESRHHFPLPPDAPRSSGQKVRRTVLAALVAECVANDRLVWSLHLLIEPDDLSWLADMAALHDSQAEGTIWARLAFDCLRSTVEAAPAGSSSQPDAWVDVIEEFWKKRLLSRALREESRWYFDEGVLLDSEAARVQREHVRRREERLDAEPARSNIRAAIEQKLVEGEADPAGQFWQLVYWLQARPLPGDRVTVESSLFITETEAWKLGDAIWRRRVVELARRYVLVGDPEPGVWYGQNLRHRPAYAGYLALRLLAAVERSKLDALPDETWARWMPVLVDALPSGDDEAHTRLLELASTRAHEDFVAWVEREFDAEVAQHRDVHVLHRVPATSDVALADRLLPRLRSGLPGPALGTSLRVLRAARPAEVLAMAWSIVEGGEREQVEVAAAFLLEVDGARAWPRFIERARQEPTLGHAVVEAMGFGFSRDRTMFSALPVAVLAEVWEWSVSLWPYREWAGARPVVSGEELWGKALAAIEEAAMKPETSDEALRCLASLAVRYPSFGWLPAVVRRAEHGARVRRWHPHELKVLLDAS